MRSPNENLESKLDEAYDQFVYAGFSEEEKARIQERVSSLQQQMSDAIDTLRGFAADREGREALARALREGVKGG